MGTPVGTPVKELDLTRYATADEIKAHKDGKDQVPLGPDEAVPEGPEPGQPDEHMDGIVISPDKALEMRPAPWDNSLWVPYTRREYLSALDHGIRPATRGVVLHVNVGYYQGTIDYFRGGSGGVGAHFEIGFDPGQITQLVPLNRLCWHAVAANADTIGVEHAGFGSSRAEWLKNRGAEIAASAHRVAWILHRFGLGKPVHGRTIFFHSDGGAAWGGHACPGNHFPYDVWHAACEKAYDNHLWR